MTQISTHVVRSPFVRVGVCCRACCSPQPRRHCAWRVHTPSFAGWTSAV